MSSTDINQLLRSRRSIRKYQKLSVAEDLLERLIELACTAPSASNRQDWFFTIVTSHSLKRAMAEKVRQRWRTILDSNSQLPMIDEIEAYSGGFADFDKAPVVIAVSANRTNAVQKQLLGDSANAVAGSIASAAMAAQNLMLAATGFGLASCCMTGAMAAAKELEEILGLEKKRTLVCFVTVGYPDEQPSAPIRKPVAAVSRFLK